MKIISLFLVCIMVLPAFAGVVSAMEYDTEEIPIEITHSLSGQSYSEDQNLMNRDMVREPDTWPIDIDGKYYGCLLPASSFSLAPGQVVEDHYINLNISSSVIGSGSGRWWVRIPIDGTTVKYLRFGCQELFSSPQLFLYSEDNPRAVFSSRGIFLNLDWPLSMWSNVEDDDYRNGSFWFRISEVTPFEGQSIRFLVSEENYHGSFYTVIADPFNQYSYYLDLVAYPAWSFVFEGGMSVSTLRSVAFNGSYESVDIDSSWGVPDLPHFKLEKRFPLGSVSNGSYVSLSFPFRGSSGFDVRFSVLNLGYGYGADFGGVYTVWANTTHTIDQHLFISAIPALSNVSHTGPVDIEICIIPRQSIRFLSFYNVDVSDNWYSGNFLQGWITRFDYPGFNAPSGYVAFDDDEDRAYFPFNVFADIDITGGAVAVINYTLDYAIYDFGWGVGYEFPGEISIFIELNNATSIAWSGNAGKLFYDSISEDMGGDGSTGDEGLLHMIKKALLELGGSLWNGIKGAITSLWNTIKKGFEWIQQYLVSLVGKVVNFLRSMIDYLGFLVDGLLFVFPPMLALVAVRFIAAPKTTVQDMRDTRKAISKGFKSSEKHYIQHLERVAAKYRVKAANSRGKSAYLKERGKE